MDHLFSSLTGDKSFIYVIIHLLININSFIIHLLININSFIIHLLININSLIIHLLININSFIIHLIMPKTFNQLPSFISQCATEL